MALTAAPIFPEYIRARSASESAYPKLWEGLVGCDNPSTGETGGTFLDDKEYRNDPRLLLPIIPTQG